MHSVDRLRAMHKLADGRTAIVTTSTDLHAVGRVEIEPPTREIVQGRKRAKVGGGGSVNQSSEPKKYKRSNLCPECGQPGHNRTTCPVSNGGRKSVAVNTTAAATSIAVEKIETYDI
jgi:hypothetical protein